MPEKQQISIIGLGLVGTSAGLALRKYQDRVTVVGHDRPNVAAAAKSMGAVDRTEWNLISAVSQADRVLLALPVGEIHDTLEAIAQELKPGCILVDTANTKTAVLRWAAELLPESVSLVGGHPILIIPDPDQRNARADLFQGKQFCLTAGGRTSDSALQLAADLVEALGAKPFFIDATEHDGMVAGVEQLPAVLAGALMEAASTSPAWGDIRKIAGSQFFISSSLTAADGKEAARACLANSEQVIRWIATFSATLDAWRERLAAGDEEGLARVFDAGLEAARKWERAYETGNWDETELPPETPTSGTYLRHLIGFGRLRQPPAKPKR